MFSTFDISLEKKELRKYGEKFWYENVLLIKRDKIYKIMYIMIPAFFFTVWAIVFFALGILNDVNYSFYWYFKLTIFLVWLFIFLNVLVRKYLNYKLDFTIISPAEVIQYNQQWFFSRPVKTISTDRIKNLNIRKEWFLQSFLDYGTIELLSDWNQNMVDLYMTHVKNPENIKVRIRNILEHI